MIVFCPNCGTQTAGLPGGRASCAACASTFDVPGDAGPRAAPAPEAPRPPPADYSAPGAQVFAPSTPAAIGLRKGAKTNTLAIVSLVAGIICCVPFISPGIAVGCGIGALKQIDGSNGVETGRGLAITGIIFGALTTIFQLLGFIGTISKRF